MNSKIERIADLVNELHDLTTDINGIYIDIDLFHGKTVHIPDKDTFFCIFKEFDIEKRNSFDNPYKVSVEIDDVEFFCVLSEQEYQQYVKGGEHVDVG